MEELIASERDLEQKGYLCSKCDKVWYKYNQADCGIMICGKNYHQDRDGRVNLG